jgi:hypothetical protein
VNESDSRIPERSGHQQIGPDQVAKWIFEAIDSGAADPFTDVELDAALQQGLDRAKSRTIKPKD